MAVAGGTTQRRSRVDVIVVYLAALLQGFTLVSIPALSNALTQQFSLSDADYGAIFLPQVLLTVLGASAGGGLAVRIGLRRLLIAALVVNVSSQLLLAVPGLLLPEFALPLILAATATLGLAFGLIGAPINSYPPMLFPTRAPTALLAVHSAIGGGLAIGPVLVSRFVEAGNWTGYPLLLAAACGTLAAAVRVSRLPASSSGQARTIVKPHRFPIERSTRARNSRLFWLFAVIAATYAFAEAAFSNWVVIYLTEARGLSESKASLALSLFWVAMVTGRLLVAALVARVRPGLVWVLQPVLITGAFLAVPHASSAEASIAAFAFAGLACSGFYPLTIALASAAFPREIAWVSSMLIAALMVGVGAGTFAIGALSQHLEFDAIYRVLALIPISLIGLAIPLVRRPRAPRPAATSGVDLAEGSRPERAR